MAERLSCRMGVNDGIVLLPRNVYETEKDNHDHYKPDRPVRHELPSLSGICPRKKGVSRVSG